MQFVVKFTQFVPQKVVRQWEHAFFF